MIVHANHITKLRSVTRLVAISEKSLDSGTSKQQKNGVNVFYESTRAATNH